MNKAITLQDLLSLSTEQDRVDLLMRDLNDGQREAALQLNGPVAAIAGAGAGKTKTLIHRTAHLLIKDVPATSIMLVTFTNKGADEIKERLEAMVGEDAQYITAGTFHSIIYKSILKAYAEHPYLESIGLDMKECSILDDSESKALFDEAIKMQDKEVQELIDEQKWDKKIEGEMAAARAKGHTAETYGREMIGFGDPKEMLYRTTMDVWSTYTKLCRAANGIDFDDILVVACQLLARDQQIGRELSERYRYLMLDEYQDTNRVQMRIMDEIAKHHENIFVVGDEKQSIYAFRGADITVILGFKSRYKGAKVVSMDINYRSTPAILDAANCIARHMSQKLTEGQLHKDDPHMERGKAIALVCFENDLQEAEVIAKAIRRDISQGAQGKDIAILYRSRTTKPVIEQALVKAGINYQVVGDIGFYQRAEVKNAIALLRFTFRPWDSMAALRVLKCTSFGVSDKSAKKAMSTGKTAHAYLTEMSEKTRGKDEPTAVAQKLKPLLSMMLCIRRLVAYGEEAGYVRQAVERMWESYLQPGVQRAAASDNAPIDEAVESRMQNVAFLLDRFFGELENGRKPEDILDELSMMGDVTKQTEQDKALTIKLMTIHGSKGMEFPYVYLPGLDADTTPGEAEDINELEEERRIFYVGLTRAMKRVNVSFSKVKRKYGQKMNTDASPYVKELSEGLGQKIFMYKAPETPSPSL